MGAYKDKNGTWYAQFRFTNWKGEPERKTKRGFATKKEALEWERDFLTQSAGNLEMTFEAFYELYKKNLQDRLKKSTWKMKTSVIESKILPYFKKKRMCDIKPRDIVAWQNTSVGTMRSRRLICIKGFQGCCPDKFLVSSRYSGGWLESTSGYRRALLAKYVFLVLVHLPGPNILSQGDKWVPDKNYFSSLGCFR